MIILVVMVVKNKNKSFFTVSDGLIGDIQVQNGWSGR